MMPSKWVVMLEIINIYWLATAVSNIGGDAQVHIDTRQRLIVRKRDPAQKNVTKHLIERQQSFAVAQSDFYLNMKNVH